LVWLCSRPASVAADPVRRTTGRSDRPPGPADGELRPGFFLKEKAATRRLLDHLICVRQQRFRDGKAERPGGLEVDDQFGPGR
jgi:hypothetical protein